jgi:two-component system cell cycle response regulator DivK
LPSPLLLLVDAHEDSRFIYATALNHRGYRVLAPEASDEALRLARIHHPALIVLTLTTYAGLEWGMLRALQHDGATAGIPVLAVSTTGMPEHRQLALQLGCADFLVKPVAPRALLAVVERLLGPVG